MDAVANNAAVPLHIQSPEEPRVTILPQEDLAVVMRHASQARATGDLRRACAFYARAIELDPNSPQAWAGRASTTSNLDEAIVSWGYSLALAPGSEARTMLSACVAEKIKQSSREQVGTIVAVGRWLAKAGQWDPAYRLFMRATELAPSNEEAWMWRAGVAGDAAESVVCLKRVLELDPQNARARAGLRWAAARIPAPTADGPQLAAAAVEDGQRALREGDCLRAHERFKRATELDTQNVSAWFWRGSTAPKIDEALTCMDRVLSIEPENEAARDARWWLHVQELRERTPTLANDKSTRTAIDPHANRSTPKKDAMILFISFTLVVLLVCGLLALLVTLRLAGIL